MRLPAPVGAGLQTRPDWLQNPCVCVDVYVRITWMVDLVADSLTAIGLGIMLWARVTLGGNWSGNVVLKEDHELVERGPYQYVRHPIYSGLLLMYLGLAIYSAYVGTLIALIAVVVGLWFKSRQEERLLTKHFPQAYASYKARVPALIPFVL
jgi:protein-S-isoprenylcysteine O-methyltransferase Ste14